MKIPVLPLITLVATVIKDAPGGISSDEWSEIGLKLLAVGESAIGIGDVSGPVIDTAAAAAHLDKVIAVKGAGHGNVLADLAALFHKHA